MDRRADDWSDRRAPHDRGDGGHPAQAHDWAVPGVVNVASGGRCATDSANGVLGPDDGTDATVGAIAAERIRQALATVRAARERIQARADQTHSEGPTIENDESTSSSASEAGSDQQAFGTPEASVPAGIQGCLESLDVALAGLAQASGLDDALSRDCLISLECAAARLEALRHGLIREVRTQGETPAKGKRLVRSILEDVCHVSASRSGQVVDSATLADPDTGILRTLGAALAAGEVTGEHVEAARRGLSHVARQILHDHSDDIDRLITEHARNHPPEATAQLIAYLEQRLNVGRLERPAHDSHRLALAHTGGVTLLSGQLDEATGRKLDALLNALLTRAISGTVIAGGGATAGQASCGPPPEGSAAVGPQHSERQEQLHILDVRTQAQRRADAFSELIDLAGDHLALVVDHATGEPVTMGFGGQVNRKPLHSVARLVLHCHDDAPTAPTRSPAPTRAPAQTRSPEPTPALTHARLDTPPGWSAPPGGGGAHGEVGSSARWAGFTTSTDDQSPMDPRLADLQSCDAVFDLARFDGRGRLISFTSVGRLASDRLTAAVVARDRCCSFPGCPRPPAMCHVHHVVWHRHGGPTSLDNLALICGPHHRLIHAQPKDPQDGWVMDMRDGLPHVRPPARLTPARFAAPPWLRNTHPADLARARNLARRLDPDLDSS